MIQNCWLLTFN